jgi:hypothetical protein
MKLTPDTLNILKNFANLNPSIVINRGSLIETVTPSGTIIASATVTDKFPAQLRLPDISRFLGVLTGIFSDPILEFDSENGKYVDVVEKNGSKRTRFWYIAESMIVSPPENRSKINEALSSPDIRFLLEEDAIQDITKSASYLGSKFFGITSNGKTMKLNVIGEKSTDDSFEMDLGESNGDTFKLMFNVDRLKFLKGSYDVEISQHGISRFTNKDLDVNYVVSLEEQFLSYKKG